MSLRLLAAPAVILLLVGGCSSPRSSPQEPASELPLGMLVIRGRSGSDAVLSVEIAETQQARRQGLMGRRHLPQDAGMVFLFERPTTAGFWMKNTLIPLSVAFWGRGGRIVKILDMRPCRQAACPSYSPGVSYVGAVEANIGFFEDAGIQAGDRVQLVRR